jgi:hypothetical protein
VAALGIYCFVRRLTGSRTGAALSAVTFSCSGLLLGYGAAQISHIEALAWAPWILFFLHRACFGEGRDAAGHGGPPLHLVKTRRSGLDIALGALCTAAALLGGYPQMWLLMALAGVALLVNVATTPGGRPIPGALVRAGAIGLLGIGLAAFQLGPAIELFMNSDRSVFLGEGQGYSPSHLAGLVVPGAEGDLGLYVGVVGLVLALLSLVSKTERRLALPWIAAAIVGLLAAMGEHTPLYSSVFSHLGFGLFRNQAWNVALLVIALSVLAGIGLSSIERRLPSGAARALVLAPGIAAANLLVVSWGNNFPGYERFVPAPERHPGILSALIADQKREPMRFVVDGRVDAFSPQGVSQYGLESMSSELNYRLSRTFQLTETDAFWRQWQLFNARFVVSPRELKTDGLTEVAVASDGQLRLYRMEFALPRAYMVWRMRPAETGEQALRQVLDGGFDPGGEVVLEGAGVQLPAPPAQPSQTITYRRVSPGEAAIEVGTSADGVLVLSAPYYPGWKVTVDGTPVPLLRANYAFNAVPIATGTHQVRFFYAPEVFRLGVVVSAISGLVVLALLVSSVLQERRRRESGVIHPV